MKSRIAVLFASIVIALVASLSPLLSHAHAGDMGDMKMPTTAPTTAPSAISNTVCPITKEPIAKDGPTVSYKGKTIGFCCSDCVKTFNENPEKYAADLK